jgi:hypothetical protein
LRLPALPLLLALLALLAGAQPARAQLSAAPGGELRVGLEAGVTWYGSQPNNGTGPAGLVRARWQPLDRLAFSAGLLAVHQPRSEGGTFTAEIVPVALEIRIDRAPIAPFLALGYALGNFRLHDASGAVRGVPAQYERGPTLGFGVEAVLDRHWAFTAQATYFGFGYFADTAQGFPFTSAITAGVEACF